ncbi:27903_t:CDS:1, partial [Racocetra persica]
QEQLQQEAKQMRMLKEIWDVKISGQKEMPLILHDKKDKKHEDTIIRFQKLIEKQYNKLKHKLHGLQNTKNELAKLQLYEVQRLISI